MWNLTPSFCKEISRKKADSVVTTLTDYDKDAEYDFFMLDVLLKTYNDVFIWIQGDYDFDYIKTYEHFSALRLIGHSLEEYEDFLAHTDCDYVGTRLHAGIRALNAKKRTVILAVDNRAIEIAKDTNLPVIPRSEIKDRLETCITADFSTDIKIPLAAIQTWKNQFSGTEESK